jgi:hypothetical protein
MRVHVLEVLPRCLRTGCRASHRSSVAKSFGRLEARSGGRRSGMRGAQRPSDHAPVWIDLTLVPPQHESRSRHPDSQGDGGRISLCSRSSRSRSRAAMNRECRPSYSSSTALALAVSCPKRRRVCMSSRCVRRNVSDRATRSSARASSLGTFLGIGVKRKKITPAQSGEDLSSRDR